jgi:predicted transcriptional regulator
VYPAVLEPTRPVAIALAAVVRHVQILEASGLVRTEKVGRTRNA